MYKLYNYYWVHLEQLSIEKIPMGVYNKAIKKNTPPTKERKMIMKYATYKWNIRLTINGKTGIPNYYGYRTKKEATEEANRWIAKGYKAEVIKY